MQINKQYNHVYGLTGEKPVGVLRAVAVAIEAQEVRGEELVLLEFEKGAAKATAAHIRWRTKDSKWQKP